MFDSKLILTPGLNLVFTKIVNRQYNIDVKPTDQPCVRFTAINFLSWRVRGYYCTYDRKEFDRGDSTASFQFGGSNTSRKLWLVTLH